MDERISRAYQCFHQEDLSQATELIDAVLKRQPKDADALVLKALLCTRQHDEAGATNFARKATNAAADRWDIQFNAGLVYEKVGQTVDALRRFEIVTKLHPTFAPVWTKIGRLRLDELALPSVAAEAFRQSLAREPADVEALYHLGKAVFQRGEVDRAIELWNQSHTLAEARGLTREARSCLQSLAISIPGAMRADNATILSVRQQWAQHCFTVRDQPRFQDRNRDPDRPLVIGYVSSFFDSENWMKPVWALINRHPREEFGIRLFSFGLVPTHDDAATGKTAFRPRESDRIFEIRNLEPSRVAEVIAAEQVDVLIDLNGYSDPRRLELMMLHPAPVVVGWFNMYATTALPCFDYLIGDEHVVKPEEEQYYSERILRVPGSYLTFEVNYPVPEVAAAPIATRDYVTFGSLGSRYKLTPELLDAWAEILRRVPHARLVLRNSGLEQEPERDALRQSFVDRGVAPERLTLLGRAPHFQFLETYGQFDIALDTFPYNGGTTTTEAIWQGVPVVAYAGRTWAARTSATLLREAGLSDWVADDLPGYIELAVRWGTDPQAREKLVSLRSSLRDRIRASSAYDTETFARSMEHIYRDVWRNWCRETA